MTATAMLRRCNSNFRFRQARAGRSPAGFTLLEVILALVILGAALAILGEVMRLANQNAVDARAETMAQVLAASLMDEIAAGVVSASNAQRRPLNVEDSTPWLYSITIRTSDIEGIQPVEVLIEQDLETRFNPARFRLIRWLPTYIETPETQSPSQEQSGSSSGSGGSQGPAGSAGGGGPSA